MWESGRNKHGKGGESWTHWEAAEEPLCDMNGPQHWRSVRDGNSGPMHAPGTCAASLPHLVLYLTRRAAGVAYRGTDFLYFPAAAES